MAKKPDSEASRLDEAARAGWLYYIAGNTQDEIAGSSAFRARRRSGWCRCRSVEKLIKVRLDHPIANCLELSERVKQKYAIDFCEVVPSDPELAIDHAGRGPGRRRRT